MEKLTVISHIKEGENLLSLPQALAEILREVDNPDFNSENLAQIILKDPSLTGRILKLANSSFYRRFSGISNVHQAVQMLGAITVKCLALSSSVFNPDRIEEASGVRPETYFTNVLMVAAAAEQIAQECGSKRTEDAFVAGLLHDIGTMFFIHHYPEEYRKIAGGKVPQVANILEAEIKVIGIDHCTAGYHLARRWHLPDFIADAISNHHVDSEDAKTTRISSMVRLASLLVAEKDCRYGMPLEQRLTVISQTAALLGLDKKNVDNITISLMSRTIAIAEYLDVEIGNIEEMLTRANQEIWHTYLMIENLFKERQEMSDRLLREERSRGAFEAKTVAMATLSHYLNNAAMAIYGRSQMIRMRLDKDDLSEVVDKLPTSLDIIDRSILKIAAVLSEMREISPIDQVEFLNTSQAMNLDDRIAKRMDLMEEESKSPVDETAVESS